MWKRYLGAFNQEKALVGAFSVIVQPVVEPMDRFTALIWSAAAGTKGEGTHTVTASITSSRGPDTVAYGHQWSALHWLLIASNKQKTLLVSGLKISRPILIWLPEHFYNAKLGWVDITIFRPTNANDYPSCLELLVIVFIVISTFIQAHTLGNTLKFKTSKYQRIVV